VFGADSLQEDVYQEVAQPILESVMSGYNGTIFAYGQTSSGKTFTMEVCKYIFGVMPTKGPDNPNEVTQGLIPRVMNNMFAIIDEADDEYLYVIKVSFLEIYNEKIHDLLDSKSLYLIAISD
jgi:kinesin family protein 5